MQSIIWQRSSTFSIRRLNFVQNTIVDKYTEDIAVSGEKIRTVLGFKPEYDLISGWQETIQEMRRNGDL